MAIKEVILTPTILITEMKSSTLSVIDTRALMNGFRVVSTSLLSIILEKNLVIIRINQRPTIRAIIAPASLGA